MTANSFSVIGGLDAGACHFGAIVCMCRKDVMFEIEEVKLSLGHVMGFGALFFYFPSCFQESKFSSTSTLFILNMWGSLLESRAAS